MSCWKMRARASASVSPAARVRSTKRRTVLAAQLVASRREAAQAAVMEPRIALLPGEVLEREAAPDHRVRVLVLESKVGRGVVEGAAHRELEGEM